MFLQCSIKAKDARPAGIYFDMIITLLDNHVDLLCEIFYYN